jgi:signal recognition particle receptor subunit beta
MPHSKTLNIIMAGPAGSGKTAFIKAVDDGVEAMAFATRRKHERWLQTATPEEVEAYRQWRQRYAAVPVNDHTTLQIFAAPPATHERHFLYWWIMSGPADGYIFLIDPTQADTFDEARYTIDTLRGYTPVPCIIAATNKEMQSALSIEELCGKVGQEADTHIMFCIATDRESARGVIFSLFDLIGDSASLNERSSLLPD